MTLITLTGPVADGFPEAEIRLVVAYGLDNTTPWPETDQVRAEAEAAVAAGTVSADPAVNESVASWQEAYRAFGTNPKRFRPSVDALLRRVTKSGVLPRISPAVDAYNSVSVLSSLPAGAFDLDRVRGDIEIRLAAEGDRFEPLGEPGAWEDTRPGEVIYADSSSVLTRHWNHRDCHRTMLRADSRNAIFILERASGKVPSERLDQAGARLAAILAAHADTVRTCTLSPAQPTAELGSVTGG
jgi:DNA/RNA-binding domain of Phe-tRNA-synthetase-like protein